MSTLRVNNLLDASGNPTDFGILGTARAWVNFNGTGTVAIRNSRNVSSVTDNGIGDYTINFTNSMPSSNYTPIATTSYFFSSSVTYLNNRGTCHPITFNTNSLRVVTGWDTQNIDNVYNMVAIFV